MSQRDKGFNGGIQAGTTAFDEESKALDKHMKVARDRLAPEFPDLTMVKMFDNEHKEKYLGGNLTGFAPDGGAWFDANGNLVAAFEGKKQNLRGNAYERWFKNAGVAKVCNEDVTYVTLCTGKGAQRGECLDKLRKLGKLLFTPKYKFFMKPEGMTYYEVEDIMRSTLRGLA
tara:strand:+ start:1018 stop:1533 length:516 start_codon:yes stop_codon:yes gene_type:complete